MSVARPHRLLALLAAATATATAATAVAAFVLAAPALGAENLGVSVFSIATGSNVYTEPAQVNSGDDSLLTALYVDSSGAAHVAYVVLDSGSPKVASEIALCTIAAGGSVCTPDSDSPLKTDGTACGEPIQSLKYLPDGNGNAILAVSFTNLYTGSGCPANPPFDPAETPPYTETEVFQPGSGSGQAIGTVYDRGGQDGGDEIYVPDETGIDIVGQYGSGTWPPPGTVDPANYYEFESFTSPSSSDKGPTALGGVQSGANLPGWWPAGVTELANGATSVLAYHLAQKDPSETNPETAPVGMYVQPAAGGSFGTVHLLGISGPTETDFTPSGATYLLNGVSTDPSGTGDPGEDLEAYDFDGTTLNWLGTVGTTDDNLGVDNTFGFQTQWDTMPPTFEDSAGDMYVAWYANGTTDACPGTQSASTSITVYGCLMYREVASGGVFGPKIVLSEDYGFSGDTDNLGDIDQIAGDPAGAGWVLVWRAPTNTSNWTLYAEPLSASASVPTSPTVTGTVTAVPVTCTGSGSCSLSATLDSAAAAASDGNHRRAADAQLAHATITIKAGRSGVLRVRETRKLREPLRARLTVVQRLGMTKAPSVIYSRFVTLR